MEWKLTVEGSAHEFVLEAEDKAQFIIGRFDPDTLEFPNVDLDEEGGLDKGVSRRHAAIIQTQDSLYLVDLQSTNGTFLNQERLTPLQPYKLKRDDSIIVGKLGLRIALPDAKPGDTVLSGGKP